MRKFTDDEKIIARNIDKEYKWIARDKNGTLCAYSLNPTKREELGEWVYDNYIRVSDLFGLELFKSIKWEDDEPTLIEDIYNTPILDDIEREYLKAVLKPFRYVIEYVEKIRTVDDRYEYIEAVMGDREIISFPYFETEKMYIGMNPNEKYSLDSLGITYD